MTKKTIMPTSEKLIKAPAGPPSCSALPELTSRPGPIMPANTLVNSEYIKQCQRRLTSNSDHL